jgi:hypothetical protein
MSRWQAFGIHLAISVLVLTALMALIFLLWYPGILFNVNGGWTGLRIVTGVDLVLGPLLTLVVFKAGKPGLRFDLTCIAVFQAACMAGGMFIVYAERSLALVLAYDTIYSLAANEFEDYGKDISVLDGIPGSYPKLVYTELPENPVQADIVAIRGQFIGDPLFMQTERYRPLPEAGTELVFIRENTVRASVSEEFKNALPEGCLLAKFVSSVTGGFVCFNAEAMQLDSFFESEVQVE